MSQERERFRLMVEMKISGDGSESLTNNHQRLNFQPCNFVNMVKFLPKFNEKDPCMFFSLFENIAEDRVWNDAEHTFLLPSVLMGKAQEAYIALSKPERRDYAIKRSDV